MRIFGGIKEAQQNSTEGVSSAATDVYRGYSLHDAQFYLESCEVGRLPFPVRRRSERVTPSQTTEETLGAMRRTLLSLAVATLSGVVVPAKRKSPVKTKHSKAHRKFANPNPQ